MPSPLADTYKLFINGEFVDAKSGKYFDVENPANGEVATRVSEAQAEDVELALDAAHAAYKRGEWRNMDGCERCRIMHRAANMLSQRVNEIAEMEVMQTGRPVKEMKAQLQRLPEWLEYFGSLAMTFEDSVPPFKGDYINIVRRVPLGVVAQLTPWNHPLLISIKKLAPAIAAGNSVVMKPSELAPVAPLVLAQILTEAGVPKGVINVVPGFGVSCGAALSSSPRVALVDMTGGTPTGRIVAAAAGRNLVPCIAELGGKAPVVVFEDCDVDVAVNGAAFAAFIASGQTCIAGTRIVVHKSLYESFVEKLTSKLEAFKIGDPMDINTQYGAVICKPQLDKVSEMVDIARKEGADILYGGMRVTTDGLDKGYFYYPTVIGPVTTSMTCWREEIFGPVTVVTTFETEQEAIDLANDSPFGLAASVWTRDVARAHRVAQALDVGLVWINDHHKNSPASPWGGTKDSGIGRENGLEAWRQYTQTHSVVVNTSNVHPNWFIDKKDVRYS